jgi:hypothetical protein
MLSAEMSDFFETAFTEGEVALEDAAHGIVTVPNRRTALAADAPTPRLRAVQEAASKQEKERLELDRLSGGHSDTGDSDEFDFTMTVDSEPATEES